MQIYGGCTPHIYRAILAGWRGCYCYERAQMTHPDKGQQAVLEEATRLAGALGDGCQQQILVRPGIWVPLQTRSIPWLAAAGADDPSWRLPTARQAKLARTLSCLLC